MEGLNILKNQKEKPIKELLEFCIINVDKPSGCTSFDVAEKIRKLSGARKSGHFGTLDPMVTGVLPVALNRACKLTTFFMKKNKTYAGEMYLHKEIGREELQKEMGRFLGVIIQKPPVKSRVKRVERERTVNLFELIRKNRKKAEFIADVEAGTYIRKLIHDLGEKIGGAHMTKLRRTKAGIFEETGSFSMEEIETAFRDYKEKGDEKGLREVLIPAEIIKEIMPVVEIKEEGLNQILTGKPLMKKDIKSPYFNCFDKLTEGDLFAVFLEARFVEVARKIASLDKSKASTIVARAEFVLN